ASLFNWQKRENERKVMKAIPSGWRNNFYEHQKEEYIFGEESLELKYRFQKNEFDIIVQNKNYKVQIISAEKDSLRLNIDEIIHHFTIVSNKNNCFVHNESIGTISLKSKDRFPE